MPSSVSLAALQYFPGPFEKKQQHRQQHPGCASEEAECASLGNSSSSIEGYVLQAMPVPPRPAQQGVAPAAHAAVRVERVGIAPFGAPAPAAHAGTAKERSRAQGPSYPSNQVAAGQVGTMCKQKSGSQFLQAKIDNGSNDERQRVYDELTADSRTVKEAASDQFGNYVVQKLLCKGSPQQVKGLAGPITAHAVFLSTHMYGCRVLQCALDVLPVDDKLRVIRELSTAIVQIVKDQHGNHVVQKCIETVPQATEAIARMLRGMIVSISKHIYGCRIVERILAEYKARGVACGDQVEGIMGEILQNLSELISDQFGNYVVQYILTTAEAPFSSAVVDDVKANIFPYSTHKFASNVVEKCLSVLNRNDKRVVMQTLTTPTCVVSGDTQHTVIPLIVMSSDQFGNYVVQKISEHADDDILAVILTVVRGSALDLVATTYGKVVLQKLAKICEERGMDNPADIAPWRSLLAQGRQTPTSTASMTPRESSSTPQPQPQPQPQLQAQVALQQFQAQQGGYAQVVPLAGTLPVHALALQQAPLHQGVFVSAGSPNLPQTAWVPQHRSASSRSVSSSSVGSLPAVPQANPGQNLTLLMLQQAQAQAQAQAQQQAHQQQQQRQQQQQQVQAQQQAQAQARQQRQQQQQQQQQQAESPHREIPPLVHPDDDAPQEALHSGVLAAAFQDPVGRVDWTFVGAKGGKGSRDPWAQHSRAGVAQAGGGAAAAACPTPARQVERRSISSQGLIYVHENVFSIQCTVGELRANVAADLGFPLSTVQIYRESQRAPSDATPAVSIGSFYLDTPLSVSFFVKPLSSVLPGRN